jgi:hypothetical protein
MLAVLEFDDQNSAKLDRWACELDDLDDEIRDVALRRDDVALGNRE